MKFNKILVTTLLVFGFVSLQTTQSLANFLFPYKNEILISSSERTIESFNFTNKGRKDINITPVIYSYDPTNENLIQEDQYLFVKADREIFTVKPEETVTIQYEVTPPSNTPPGTYFNLIVLQGQSSTSFLQEENPVNVLDSLSHLVVLHISDSDTSIFGISSDFAMISFEIIEKGIPFIKPTKVRYTYQNITNYVLEPMGEIQIFSEKGKYAPKYIKINKEETKLYPKEILEEEFLIESKEVVDFIYKRIIVGRFYNGIDENFIPKTIHQQPNYTIPAILIGTLVLIYGMVKVKTRKKTE